MGDTGLFLAYLGAFRVCRHLRHELLEVVGEVGLLQRNLLPAAVVEPLLHGRRDVSYRPLFQLLSVTTVRDERRAQVPLRNPNP